MSSSPKDSYRRAAHNLSSERIHQLLAAIGSRRDEDPAQREAPSYDWCQPHYFGTQELAKLDDFTRRLTMVLAEKFHGFCRNRFDVTITSTTFHFAGEVCAQTSNGESMDYRLPFGADPEHACGFLGIPEETAVVWARQLLGDCESENGSDRALSQLEESLLLDLASALVEVFSALEAHGGLHPAGRLLRGRWPLETHDTEELCRISFDVNRSGSEDDSQSYFLIACEQLNSIVGRVTQGPARPPAAETSKVVLSHLQKMPIAVTVQLVSTVLAFREIMTLRVNDVVLLDKKVDEPVDLIVDGRTVYQGWPVKSGGKYAVTIVPATPRDVS
jgi:flagellar motor switch protein FliM